MKIDVGSTRYLEVTVKLCDTRNPEVNKDLTYLVPEHRMVAALVETIGILRNINEDKENGDG